MSVGPIRSAAEYLLARCAMAVIPRLPRWAVLRLAGGFGVLAYFFSRHLRRVGLANLAVARPNLPVVAHRRILRRSFRTFALVILDTFWLSRDTVVRIRDLVHFHDSYAKVFQPGPLVCVSAHLGNWEVLGMAITQRGYPLVSVVAPLKNRRVDAMFNELRNLTGQTMVAKQGAVRRLLKALRGGGKIALLLDQNTKPVDGGIFVDFFGRKAPVSTAAALLALRTGADIVVGACLPADDGSYHTPPLLDIDATALPADHDEAVAVLTQRIADGITHLVAEHPEHWLWAYKRWKIRPDGEPAEQYPFYTRALRAGDLPTRGSRQE